MHESNEVAPKFLTNVPQLLVRYGGDILPELDFIMMMQPCPAEVAVKEPGQIRSNPGRGMDTVSHHLNWATAFSEAGPDRLAHLSCYSPVHLTYCVDTVSGSQGQSGQAEQNNVV